MNHQHQLKIVITNIVVKELMIQNNLSIKKAKSDCSIKIYSKQEYKVNLINFVKID